MNKRRTASGKSELRFDSSAIPLVTFHSPRRPPLRDELARRLPPRDVKQQLTADAWNVALSSARPPYVLKPSGKNPPLHQISAAAGVHSQWLDDFEESNACVETALRVAWAGKLEAIRRRYPYVSVAGRVKSQRFVNGEPPKLSNADARDVRAMDAGRYYRLGSDADMERNRVYTLGPYIRDISNAWQSAKTSASVER